MLNTRPTSSNNYRLVSIWISFHTRKLQSHIWNHVYLTNLHDLNSDETKLHALLPSAAHGLLHYILVWFTSCFFTVDLASEALSVSPTTCLGKVTRVTVVKQKSWSPALSRFYSWVAGAMGVKFLTQGNNSGSKSQLGIESGTSQCTGRCTTSWATLVTVLLCYWFCLIVV